MTRKSRTRAAVALEDIILDTELGENVMMGFMRLQQEMLSGR